MFIEFSERFYPDLTIVGSVLDAAFDGRASASDLRHAAHNWSREPYAQGAYSYGFAGDEATTKAALAAAVDDKLFFSGEALSVDNGSTVPGAMETAYAAIEDMLTRS